MGCSASSRSAISTQKPGPALQERCVQPEALAPMEFAIKIERSDKMPIGMRMKQTSLGFLIWSIFEHGSLGSWNTSNPGSEVRPGDVIVRVNDISGDMWKMGEALSQNGDFEIGILRRTVFDVKRRISRSGNRWILASGEEEVEKENAKHARYLPHVNADECGSTTCAVCMEDYSNPKERLVQLPCKHSFHVACVAKWFQKGRQRCPLCNLSIEEVIVLGSTQPIGSNSCTTCGPSTGDANKGAEASVVEL